MKAVSLIHHFTDESGQSILEIVFILPFLFTFIALLYKINMAAQIAINNVQYARSQMFILTANSSEYPRLSFRFGAFNPAASFHTEGHARMVLGVADPEAVAAAGASDSGTLEPIPPIQNIARRGTTQPGSNAAGEPKNRTDVRVRNTVAICTQFNSAKDGGRVLDWYPSLLARMSGSKRWPFGENTVCKYEDKD